MTIQLPSPAPQQLLRLPAVLSLTGLSRSTIYRLIEAGRFPAGIKLTQHTTAWAAGEVSEWIQSRIEARDQP